MECANVTHRDQAILERLARRRATGRRTLIKAAAAGLMAGATQGVSLFAKDKLTTEHLPTLMPERGEGLLLLALARAGRRVFAAGEHGVILFSDDDGASWRQADVPVNVSLTSVHFLTAQKGWAVGHAGVVLRTSDGGATWNRQSTAALKQDAADRVLFDVRFSDEHRGHVVGAYGLILATTDGGDTWLSSADHVSDNPGRHLYCVRAIEDQLYIVGEQGTFFRSSDGGKRFTAVRTPYPISYFGMLADASNSLVIFGFGGHAYRSRDAGHHWQRVATSSGASLTAGALLSDGSIVLGDQAGAVLRSTGKGQDFLPVSPPTSFPVTGITEANDGQLILSGANGIGRIRMMPTQRKAS